MARDLCDVTPLVISSFAVMDLFVEYAHVEGSDVRETQRRVWKMCVLCQSAV